jgi:hypothetical protein
MTELRDFHCSPSVHVSTQNAKPRQFLALTCNAQIANECVDCGREDNPEIHRRYVVGNAPNCSLAPTSSHRCAEFALMMRVVSLPADLNPAVPTRLNQPTAFARGSRTIRVGESCCCPSVLRVRYSFYYDSRDRCPTHA